MLSSLHVSLLLGGCVRSNDTVIRNKGVVRTSWVRVIRVSGTPGSQAPGPECTQIPGLFATQKFPCLGYLQVLVHPVSGIHGNRMFWGPGSTVSPTVPRSRVYMHLECTQEVFAAFIALALLCF
jgi:hypothetical protein